MSDEQRLRPEGETVAETLAILREQHTSTKFRQLSYSPVYFDNECILKAIDELEGHVARREMLSPLQSLAVRMLVEGINT